MAYTCQTHAIHMSNTRQTHAIHMSYTWQTHVIHMSYTCQHTCQTHVIHMSNTGHTHVIHMSTHMSYSGHTHVIHMSYTCHTHVIHMSYICQTLPILPDGLDRHIPVALQLLRRSCDQWTYFAAGAPHGSHGDPHPGPYTRNEHGHMEYTWPAHRIHMARGGAATFANL